MNNYKPYFTIEFNHRIQKYQGLKKQIANKIRQKIKNPYRAAISEQLVGNLKGLRSAQVTSSLRIIYAICQECRQYRNEELVGCSPELCVQMNDDVIIFLTLEVDEQL